MFRETVWRIDLSVGNLLLEADVGWNWRIGEKKGSKVGREGFMYSQERKYGSRNERVDENWVHFTTGRQDALNLVEANVVIRNSGRHTVAFPPKLCDHTTEYCIVGELPIVLQAANRAWRALR